MKRIRRNISPVLMAGLGIWFLVRQNASMEILAIIVMVLSALGIVLHVTDKESTKAGKAAHIGLNGLFIGGGAWLLISPITFNRYLKYILGGLVILYCLLNLRRMFRFRYRKGARIAECVPAALGVALMLIPLGEGIFTPVSGGVLTAAGVVTLLCNLFGKKKAGGKPAAGA